MKMILLTGVDTGGYGNIEKIDADNCGELLRKITNTDKGQCLAIVFDDKNIISYIIRVSRETIPTFIY